MKSHKPPHNVSVKVITLLMGGICVCALYYAFAMYAVDSNSPPSVGIPGTGTPHSFEADVSAATAKLNELLTSINLQTIAIKSELVHEKDVVVNIVKLLGTATDVESKITACTQSPLC